MPEPAAEQAAPPAPDPTFAGSERLFRRIHPDHLLDGFLADAFLPFPSFSVNREKYSRPEEVIRDHPSFGIAAFTVGAIPPELESETGQVFQCGVEHAPLPDNYAHSEVHSYLGGLKAKPSRIVRKRFRDLLRQRTIVLKRPDLETIALSTDPGFQEIIQSSRDRQTREGGLSSTEIRRRLEDEP